MTLALLALLALGLVLAVGILRPEVHVGVLALALTFALGGWGAGLDAARLMGLFPSALVLTVLGVALLFELAQQNGTLAWLTGALLARIGAGRRRLVPVLFVVALLVSALGPGNIAAVALLAPLAMPLAARTGVSPLLMAIALCTGANAGAFSPLAVTGSLNAALMRDIGVSAPEAPLTVFAAVAALQAMSALLAWALFGRALGDGEHAAPPGRPGAPDPAQRLTLLALAAFVALVAVLGLNAAAAAFVLAALLTLLRSADTAQALRRLPWDVLLLIGGIGTLVGLLGELGSLTLATDLLARASPGVIHALLAAVAGVLSVGSSSSGVVMPLMVPLVPGLAERVPALDLLSGVVAVDVGAHLVDVSPLSTLGALCLAALDDEAARARVFRSLLAWGLGMVAVGAALAWVWLDVL